jgi:hypothetical protein
MPNASASVLEFYGNRAGEANHGWSIRGSFGSARRIRGSVFRTSHSDGIVEPCQPCNDLARFKAEYGERLVFCGGINTQKLLPFGTPEDVRREATEVIRTLGKGAGTLSARRRR